jgi:hypothetical protein
MTREQPEEDRGDLVLLCPPELETATGVFDPAGYDPGDCAGCGAARGEHIDPADNPGEASTALEEGPAS